MTGWLHQITSVIWLAVSTPMKELYPGVSPPCWVTVLPAQLNWAMPSPYFAPSGFAGSSGWMLSSHFFWHSAFSTLPPSSADIHVTRSFAVDVAPPAASANEWLMLV